MLFRSSQLTIVAGHASRSKTVAVTGITAAALTAALTGLTDEAGEGVRG